MSKIIDAAMLWTMTFWKAPDGMAMREQRKDGKRCEVRQQIKVICPAGTV
ncbi:MAG: hypothetical protein K2W78_07595 [Xanthobacteraceae bacterium]|nr:hypothetical protein [Xanthobacteraceae bacterium]